MNITQSHRLRSMLSLLFASVRCGTVWLKWRTEEKTKPGGRSWVAWSQGGDASLPTPTQDFLVGCLPPSRSRRKIWNVSCSFPVLSHFVIHVFQPVKLSVQTGLWLSLFINYLCNFHQLKKNREFCRSLIEIQFFINQVGPAVGSVNWLVVVCDLVSF